MFLVARMSGKMQTVSPVSVTIPSSRRQDQGRDKTDVDVPLVAQCPAEGCNGERAYFYQLQIRSADEPMTTFLRVGSSPYISARCPPH